MSNENREEKKKEDQRHFELDESIKRAASKHAVIKSESNTLDLLSAMVSSIEWAVLEILFILTL